MEPIMILLGLIIWILAIIGVILGGKHVLRWFTGMVARDPEGFRKSLGFFPDNTTKI